MQGFSSCSLPTTQWKTYWLFSFLGFGFKHELFQRFFLTHLHLDEKTRVLKGFSQHFPSESSSMFMTFTFEQKCLIVGSRLLVPMYCCFTFLLPFAWWWSSTKVFSFSCLFVVVVSKVSIHRSPLLPSSPQGFPPSFPLPPPLPLSPPLAPFPPFPPLPAIKQIATFLAFFKPSKLLWMAILNLWVCWRVAVTWQSKLEMGGGGGALRFAILLPDQHNMMAYI